ncbi:heavy-metal-associated domain-containing protein [Desulforamulus putei]|uniref:heavy-metal-associated domain-containing protein n=1 Tax=Desulforamulus putei TaxID=74701 RepID=UPI003A5C0444
MNVLTEPTMRDHRNMTKTFKLGGLQGGRHDKEEIETYLSEIDGVAKVIVNLEDGTVTVDFDPGAIHPDYLRGTLRSLGYDILV